MDGRDVMKQLRFFGCFTPKIVEMIPNLTCANVFIHEKNKQLDYIRDSTDMDLFKVIVYCLP